MTFREREPTDIADEFTAEASFYSSVEPLGETNPGIHRFDTSDSAPPHRVRERFRPVAARLISRRFKIDAAILGREHRVLIYRTAVVKYMLGTKQNDVATSADNPGVVVLPPLLYGSALVVVLALHWYWLMPIFGDSMARWSGLALIVFAVAIAILGK